MNKLLKTSRNHPSQQSNQGANQVRSQSNLTNQVRSQTSLGARRLKLDQRKQALLDLGVRLFGEQSYDEISIDEIAAAAGISKGLLYHYFPSKRDFYVAAVSAAADRLIDDTRAAVASAPLEPHRAGLDAYLGYVETHERAYLMVMQSGLGFDPEVGAVVERARQEYVEFVLDQITEDARTPLLKTALRSWIGSVEAAAYHWLKHKDVQRDTLRELLVRQLESALVAVQDLQSGAGCRD